MLNFISLEHTWIVFRLDLESTTTVNFSLPINQVNQLTIIGSGSALLLELSKAVLKYKTKTKVRFAWWGAEENGLVGSKYYCSNLKAHEINRILAYLNFDMVSKGYFGVGDTDGSSHGSIGPAGSEVIEQIYIDYYTSKGLQVTPAILTNGSDYNSFWNLNKPFGVSCHINLMGSYRHLY